MLRWNNDYNRNCHPAVLEALRCTSEESFGGYGIDTCCQRAEEIIQSLTGRPDAQVHFLLGGTQANFTVLAAALLPYQSAVCADSGHINAHETGAVEHTGHKILTVPNREGKITAAQIARTAENFRVSEIQEHITEPKLVYISHPTEFGTLYTRSELEEMRKVCDEYGMYLFLDGARLGYGLASEASDLTLKDIARLTDAFYIGGTKCGALFGEAVVLLNPALKPRFRSYIKQNGGMLAKGWLLGLQFCALLESGIYFDITRKAVAQAMRLKETFREAGIPLYLDSPTNQQFVILTKEQADTLAKKHVFELQEAMPDGRLCVRFCTSWSTPEEDVDTLRADILALA